MLTLTLISNENKFHKLEDLLRCWYSLSYPYNFTLLRSKYGDRGAELSSGTRPDCDAEQHICLRSFSSQIRRVQNCIYAARAARAEGSRIILNL
jgi:hypothetical protein